MLSSFSITSFHGIRKLDLSLGLKTYIQGANGSGKTHILDAIHLLSGSSPIYGNVEMQPGCLFEGAFLEGDLLKRYHLAHDEQRSVFSIQGTKITKPKYLSSLPWRTVYISPFDMNLLYFAPSMRRDAMDITLARVYEQFSRTKKDYEEVMRQRNALLKRIRDGESQKQELDFWDDKFSVLAETYLSYRYRYAEYIQSALSRFPGFFSRYNIEFHYESSSRIERDKNGSFDMTERATIQEYLLRNRERDIIIGHTHIGPHRDDWGFVLPNTKKGNGQKADPKDSVPAQSYLSRGEMKMLLLGLKMIEAEFTNHVRHLPVIILIDDIFAELDERNSETFLNSLTTYQIILTSQKPLQNHEKYHDFICINLEYS